MPTYGPLFAYCNISLEIVCTSHNNGFGHTKKNLTYCFNVLNSVLVWSFGRVMSFLHLAQPRRKGQPVTVWSLSVLAKVVNDCPQISLIHRTKRAYLTFIEQPNIAKWFNLIQLYTPHGKNIQTNNAFILVSKFIRLNEFHKLENYTP